MSVPVEHFERLYAGDPDPWRFATSEYEREKYRATLAALDRPAYAHALEIGCSIGVFTRALAPRCERLLALDAVEAPLAHARAGCAARHVNFRRALVPAEWPEGRFDLILLSEVLYYLGPDGIAATAARARASLLPGGIVLAVDYLGETGSGLGGDEAVRLFEAAFGASHPVARTGSYRIDRFAA